MQDFEGSACLEGKLPSHHLGSSCGVPESLRLSGACPFWVIAHFPLLESTPSSSVLAALCPEGLATPHSSAQCGAVGPAFVKQNTSIYSYII